MTKPAALPKELKGSASLVYRLGGIVHGEPQASSKYYKQETEVSLSSEFQSMTIHTHLTSFLPPTDEKKMNIGLQMQLPAKCGTLERGISGEDLPALPLRVFLVSVGHMRHIRYILGEEEKYRKPRNGRVSRISRL